MLTFNAILNAYDGWQDIGQSYDDPDMTVYSGDLWALAKCFKHKNSMQRLEDIAQYYGIELRFYDETITDGQGRVHNTTPQFYGWTPTFKVFDCDVWARDEVDSDTLQDYADLLMDDTSNADQWDTDFSPLGFRQWQEIGESGWHHGQNDTPEKMRQSIESKHGECNIIWFIDSTGQFDCHFGAWFKPIN